MCKFVQTVQKSYEKKKMSDKVKQSNKLICKQVSKNQWLSLTPLLAKKHPSNVPICFFYLFFIFYSVLFRRDE